MFDQLLSILKRGGTLTIDQMAHELNTTPGMVLAMIEHLSRSGQLKQLDINCDSACSHCALANDCQRLSRGRVWHSV
jgi:DNA-binding Lrp family transcriptional regulator